MAQTNYRSQFHYSNAGQLVKLIAKVNIGATGAPTLVAGTGMGISSIVRTGAGAYTVNLQNPANALLDINLVFKSSSAPAAPDINIASDANVGSVSAPSISFVCRNNSGVATDPASGEVMYLEIDLNRSSLSY